MNKENTETERTNCIRKKGQGQSKIRVSGQSGEQAGQGESKKGLFNKYMKYLISTNVSYFKNKLCADSKNKHKNIQFKIPSSTGSTIYKKDFIEKHRKTTKQQTLKHTLSTDSIKMNNYLKPDSTSLNLDGKTTYQKQYRHHTFAASAAKSCTKRGVKMNTDEDVPRFFDTQNKVDYLNWGGKNYVPSMKPEYKSAVTNCVFQANSVYKNDFQRKIIKNTPTFIREQSFPKFGNWSSVMKTSYSNDFSEKNLQTTEINCKPKQFPTSYFKELKGSTEYKRQFLKNPSSKAQTYENEISLQSLQQLIIDL